MGYTLQAKKYICPSMQKTKMGKRFKRQGVMILRIGIIDADLLNGNRHHMPNLACMKISGYHKQIGNQVHLLTEYSNLERFDRVYLSKVFTGTQYPQEVLSMEHVVYGGTGFYLDQAPELPCKIEHAMPDYNLYEKWLEGKGEEGKKSKKYRYYRDYSIGFLTRGCFRQCSFCINRKKTVSVPASPVAEFFMPQKKKICLLDDNFLACKEWNGLLRQLRETDHPIQFRQGLDIRLITLQAAMELASCRLDGDLIFAFDNIKDKDVIIEKMKIINPIFQETKRKRIKFYVLTGFDATARYNQSFWGQDIFQTFERIRILMENRAYPYIMRYERYQESPYRGMYVNLSRWCNQPHMYQRLSFREFCFLAKEGSACRKYLEEFERNFPEMKSYFDMKY